MRITIENVPNNPCKYDALEVLDGFELRPSPINEGFYNLWHRLDNGEFKKVDGMCWGTSAIGHILEKYGQESGMKRIRCRIELDVSVHARLFNKMDEIAEKQGKPCSWEQREEAVEEAYRQYGELVEEAKAQADKTGRSMPNQV